MSAPKIPLPDSTAVRVALWRYLHTQIDSKPFIFQDELGFQLANPASDWKQRSDMDSHNTSGFRASIVARARFVEDFLFEKFKDGLQQYVILGAGLDTFAQRQSKVASKLEIFEIDRPEPQLWKQNRLKELDFYYPASLHFVPVNFELDSWWEKLLASGFDSKKKTIISSLGVSMYISKEATMETLRNIVSLQTGSTLVMSYLIPFELVEPEDQLGLTYSMKGAAASGTPFISFYTADDIQSLAIEAGFKNVKVISTINLREKYFKGRKDNLRLSSGEEILVATI